MLFISGYFAAPDKSGQALDNEKKERDKRKVQPIFKVERSIVRRGNILECFLLAIVILLIIGFVAYYRITKIPAEFTPGIYAGEGFLQKNLFAEDERIDVVTDIKFGQLDPNDGLEYCIAGNMGAIFRDEDGNQFGYKRFKSNKSPVREYEIVTDGRSGKCSFRADSIAPWNKARSRDIPRKIDKRFPYGEIAIASFPTMNDEPHFIIFQNETGKYLVLNKEGIKKAELDMRYLSDLKGIPIRFKSDEPPYFAVLGKMCFQGTLVGFKAIRAALFVFDSNQKLVYHEVLEDETSVYGTAILSVPSGNKDESALLVGCTGRVWEYKAGK